MIPSHCQICLFSQTISEEIIKFSEDIMTDPVKIVVEIEMLTLEGLKQFYLSCSDDISKYEKLLEIFAKIDASQIIIYFNTKEKAERLAQMMFERNLIISCIHESMEQEKRNTVLKNFREGNPRILITSELLAMGIDVYRVGLVVNFELPVKKENYIHRIGRSGKFGRRGLAINLISDNEASYLTEIQEFYHTHIAQLPNDLTEID
jgi:translation initiation factor 4A